MSARKVQKLNCDSCYENFLQLTTDTNPDSVLVALSGGPDSVALLSLMLEISKRAGVEIYAAHVNYGLRGKESEKDQQFCIDLCKQLGIKLFRKKTSLANLKAGNLQEKARQIRYDYFEKLCDKHNINFILIGHNISDSVETMLLNLFRGAGGSGLSGIAGKSGRVLRPLLSFSRQEILDYLQDQKIPYRTDRSNLQTKYSRNKIRISLIPQIENLFSKSVVANISRSAQLISEQERYLNMLASKHFQKSARLTTFGKIVLDLKQFRKYNIMLQRIMLGLAYERLTGSHSGFEFAATDRVLKLIHTGSGKVDFIANLFAEVTGRNLYLYRKESRPKPVRLLIPGRTDLKRLHMFIKSDLLSADKVSYNEIRSGENWKVYFDNATISNELIVRTALPGDRFQPLGMKGSKKMSDFFVDRKVDRPLREEIPIICAGKEILWVVGLAVSDQVKITELTRQVIKLEVEPYRDA